MTVLTIAARTFGACVKEFLLKDPLLVVNWWLAYLKSAKSESRAARQFPFLIDGSTNIFEHRDNPEYAIGTYYILRERLMSSRKTTWV